MGGRASILTVQMKVKVEYPESYWLIITHYFFFFFFFFYDETKAFVYSLNN